MYPLKKDVKFLKGVGSFRCALLKKIGITTIEDLLNYFPSRYQDRSKILLISQVFSKENEFVCLQAKVFSIERRKSKNFVYYQALIGDKTDFILCIWFGEKRIDKILFPSKEYIFYGKVQKFRNRFYLLNPEFEEKNIAKNFKGIIPLYSLPSSLSQNFFRNLVREALLRYGKYLKEFLPFTIREEMRLPNINLVYKNIHFPQTQEDLELAKKRFVFEEFFLFETLVFLRKARFKLASGPKFQIPLGLMKEVERFFKITFTPSQRRSLEEMFKDVSKGSVMRRLLQGEVGSGKTLVATTLALLAILNSYQVAFMVPTEILALQHYLKLKDFFKKKGFKIELFTSSSLKAKRQILLRELSEGKIHIALGTHSLIEEELRFKKLGLVIIDEQHKFGVLQRAELIKKGVSPHLLVMTATPIPRTLSMTLYGDLDISFLKELPLHIKRARTLVLYEDEKEKVFSKVREYLKKGSQIYFVYPLIGESKFLDFKNVLQGYQEIKEEFKDYKVEMIHSKINQGTQKQIMENFANNKIQILVSTQIIEIGIDNPRANCLVIESAHRFGLSQLHQLRGRVQRSSEEGLCILTIPRGISHKAKKRIEIFASVNDGFKISEEDLRIRGPGDFFGVRQHGNVNLKLTDPLKNIDLLLKARKFAYEIIKSDPRLENTKNEYLKIVLEERFSKCMWFQVD